MKKTLCAMVGAGLLSIGFGALAADEMPGHGMMNMDANSDGKITKEEFMAAHEKMWAGLKKNADGTVDAKMMMHHEGMMHGEQKGVKEDAAAGHEGH